MSMFNRVSSVFKNSRPGERHRTPPSNTTGSIGDPGSSTDSALPSRDGAGFQEDQQSLSGDTILGHNRCDSDASTVASRTVDSHDETTSSDEESTDGRPISDSPCYCSAHPGCCRKHRSTARSNLAPVTTRSGSPSEKTSTSRRDSQSSTSYTIHESEGRLKGVGHASTYTLTPIHPSLCYHLCHDNLACIRQQLGPASTQQPVFIPELSSRQSITSYEDIVFYWSNEIYFSNGTFLQIQKVECTIHQGDNRRYNPQRFTACPHHSLTIPNPSFGSRDGFREVQATVENTPPRCPNHPEGVRWGSYGPLHTQMVVCTICHSDAECVLREQAGGLHIWYTCYRDLGSGEYPDGKWMALLTGEGDPCRSGDKLDLYSRVWNTGCRLQRAGMESFSHEGPWGIFNVSSRQI
jgi:hypothetical protein